MLQNTATNGTNNLRSKGQTMTENENRVLYIAEECRKAGVTLAGASGILANIEAESAFNPINVQDSYEPAVGDDVSYTAKVDSRIYDAFTRDAAGFGICQWTASDRKGKMLAYFWQKGVSIGDFVVQVEFMLYEMKGYTKAWNTVTASADPYECGYAVCKYYEIPANTEAQANQRGNRARHWYNWLADQYQSGTAPAHELPTAPTAPAKTESGVQSAPGMKLRTIDKGIEGWPEVWLLQALLKVHDYPVMSDGIFGKSLTEKLEAFQRASGLEPDGICGPKTWAALGLDPAIFKQ